MQSPRGPPSPLKDYKDREASAKWGTRRSDPKETIGLIQQPHLKGEFPKPVGVKRLAELFE